MDYQARPCPNHAKTIGMPMRRLLLLSVSLAVVLLSYGSGVVKTARSQTAPIFTPPSIPNWTTQAAIPLGPQRVVFADHLHGWAISGDYVAATEDGGDTWNLTEVNPSDPLEQIAFADASHGYVLSGNGVLRRTTTGGRTWIRVPTRNLPPWNGMTHPILYAPSANTLYDWVSDPLAVRGLYGSSNGGITWRRTLTATSTALNESISVVGPEEIWTLQSTTDSATNRTVSRLLHTTDGGATWRSVPVPAPTSATNPWTEAVFADAHTGYLIGTDIAYTHNGGVSWSMLYRAPIKKTKPVTVDLGGVGGFLGTPGRATTGTLVSVSGQQAFIVSAHYTADGAAMADGMFYNTTNAGSVWQATPVKGPLMITSMGYRGGIPYLVVTVPGGDGAQYLLSMTRPQASQDAPIPPPHVRVLTPRLVLGHVLQVQVDTLPGAQVSLGQVRLRYRNMGIDTYVSTVTAISLHQDAPGHWRVSMLIPHYTYMERGKDMIEIVVQHGTKEVRVPVYFEAI